MSLNFDMSKIENYDELWRDGPEGRELEPVTQALVFATMAVGLGEITEANAADFFARFKVVEALGGPYVIRSQADGGGPYELTVEDIQRHIGLSTNVSDETEAQWLKRWMKQELADRRRGYTRAIERQAKEKAQL